MGELERSRAKANGTYVPQTAKPLAKNLSKFYMVEDRYCWRQDRDFVQVNVFVPPHTKGKEVSFIIRAFEMQVLVNQTCILKGDWLSHVVPPEDPNDPDWEIVDYNGRRAAQLTLQKREVPGSAGEIIHWWNRLLKGDGEAIDTLAI